MVSATPAVLTNRLTLCADAAQDLMTPNPISVRDDATLRDLIVLLTDKGIAAAPVIDEAGHPVGVVSRADVITHERELAVREPEPGGDAGETAGETLVRDIMTPVLFSVRPDTPAARVVEELVAMKVHRLFVIDEAGTLVGVISTFDVLQRLQPECAE